VTRSTDWVKDLKNTWGDLDRKVNEWDHCGERRRRRVAKRRKQVSEEDLEGLDISDE
jgi:hypothetical protein